MTPRYHDRGDAGRVLAWELAEYEGRDDIVVLGLPRGGVPVAYEVARSLGAPLDVVLVRKIGTPGQPELAMGAVASGDELVVNRAVTEALGIPEAVVGDAARRERAELLRRERLFRGDRPPPDLAGRIVIVVDDGIATGTTMRAALAAVRRQRPEMIVVAAPTASVEAVESLRGDADRVICPHTPEAFQAVGTSYEDFPQVDDDEVRRLLEASRALGCEAGPPVRTGGRHGRLTV